MATDKHTKPEDLESLTISLEELSVEASSVLSTKPDQSHPHDDGAVDSFEQDDVWDDGSDDLNHGSILDREWNHRQNQFHKMGYRDGITEGQKDSAQEGFNAGFRQSVHLGYKWGLVRGITSALGSLSDSMREKLVPNIKCREKLQALHNSIQEISADDALKMYHESILRKGLMDSCDLPEQKSQIISEADKDADSSRLESLSKDLVFLLAECPEIAASEELMRDP